MESTQKYLKIIGKWIIRKPHWGAWVYTLFVLAVEWSVHHSALQALNVFAANFLLYHLLGKYGIIIAFTAILNVGENLYDGKTLRVPNFSFVLALSGVIGIFASLLGAALLVGYAKDQLSKTQNTDESLGALGWMLLISGLIAAFVGLNTWPNK